MRTYHIGWDVFTPEPGTAESLSCKACGTNMNVERNVREAARFGKGRLCDRFTCPHAGESWHSQVIAIKQLCQRLPSAVLERMLQEEAAEICRTRTATKKPSIFSVW